MTVLLVLFQAMSVTAVLWEEIYFFLRYKSIVPRQHSNQVSPSNIGFHIPSGQGGLHLKLGGWDSCKKQKMFTWALTRARSPPVYPPARIESRGARASLIDVQKSAIRWGEGIRRGNNQSAVKWPGLLGVLAQDTGYTESISMAHRGTPRILLGKKRRQCRGNYTEQVQNAAKRSAGVHPTVPSEQWPEYEQGPDDRECG